MNENDLLAEKLLASDEVDTLTPETHCHFASILYHYGKRKEKGRPFLLALNHLMQAEELAPDLSSSVRHLWGNVLKEVGKRIRDHSFFERALLQYEQADRSAAVLNDWADAWLQLGLLSGEESDLKQAFDLFNQLPAPSVRQAEAHTLYAAHTGNPVHVEEALVLLREMIAQDDSRAAWCAYARATKCRYELTHLESHFQEADTALREAILSAPEDAALWLEWGALYLDAGWLRHDLKHLETALDKLTSSKVKQANPLDAAALIGKALLFLGLVLDEFQMLCEGRERIITALEMSPDHPGLLTAAGFAEFTHAFYFADKERYARAVAHFEEGIEENGAHIEDWLGLFQTYVSWGLLEKNPSLVQKGIEAIARISQLRPHSPVYLSEWGIALLQLNQEDQLEEAVLKFKAACALQEEGETLFHWGCALDQMGDLSGQEKDYEEAIDLLSRVYEQNRGEPQVCYRLALAYSHLGELTADVDVLFKAVDLLMPLADSDPEDAVVWADLGYALLNISELVFDPAHNERGEEFRREAERYLLHAAELGNGSANYHLACLYTLAKLHEPCFQFLKRAKEADALPASPDLEHDEWLANVRETPQFREFL